MIFLIQAFHVLGYLKQLISLDEAGAAEALPLCATALEEIRCRLRNGPGETDPRVTAAAAAQALYKWKQRERADEALVTGFKAGDVSIRHAEDSLVAAKALRDEAMLAAAPLLKDEGFLFRQVEI